ncbi:TraB/TrbI/VirB10 family type IV secretion system protein [Pseudoroseomonas sp. WGS1072]|uniref:TrbI/VirB10 family protein n=1 Tax=Roseomonas sp. WGS1072 TaxID=3366816 RepID=UPI003BF2DE94
MSENGNAPPVGQGRRPMGFAGKIGIVTLGIGAAFAVWLINGGPQERQPPARDVGVASGEAGTPRPVFRMPPPEPVATATPVVLPPPSMTLQPSAQAAPSSPARPIKPSPIMAYEARSPGGTDDHAAPALSMGQGGLAGGEEDGLATRLRASRTEGARARRLRNPHLTLTQGSLIGCIRETPVNTQLPGFVRCQVPEPVMSTTGTTVLLPAGTRLVGQVRQAMTQGQNRAFILWQRAETPDSVVVDLASPGTDPMGTPGIPVEVHSNFWARFGGAIMLSFIDAGLQAAAQAAANATEGDGTRITFNTARSGGTNAASRALDATVNIPPYGTSPAGAQEAVFVARDLDFSDVYELRLR